MKPYAGLVATVGTFLVAGLAMAQDPAPEKEEKRFEDHLKVPLDTLVERLRSGDAVTRSRAAAAIALHAIRTRTGVILRPKEGASERFRSPDPVPNRKEEEEKKGQALAADLTRARKEYAKASLILRELIHYDPDEGVRMNATVALGELAPRDKQALRVFVRALEDESTRVRYAAVSAFAVYRTNASSVVPKLAMLLKKPDWNVKTHAAVALALIGDPKGDVAVLAFTKAVSAANTEQRKKVAQVLRTLMLDWMKKVVPALVEELKEDLKALEK